MIKLFLACALALPAANYSYRMVAPDPKIVELERLKEFIHSHVPGADWTIIDKEKAMPAEWERLPLLWRDMQIWIKRPIIYDMPERKLIERSA